MAYTVAGVTIGKRMSWNFMTNFQKLHRGIWPWTVGLKSRLPMHYKRRYVERHMNEARAVHYRFDDRKFIADKWGNPQRVQNVPLPIVFPKEADMGLWGGEGIVAGFKKKANDPMKPRAAKVWLPYLSKRVFYSEILDRHIAATVTRRTLDLIDAACGFDHYILGTNENDLCSKFGMLLKRKMLKALADKSMYPNDLAKRDFIYEKYRTYEIPAEEVEWIGLSLYEAEQKQYQIEEAERLKNLRPLKDVYAENLAAELIEKLKTDLAAEGSKSFLSRISIFKDKNSDS